MKEIGVLPGLGGIKVFVDKYVDKMWINIAKGGRVIKINPKLIEELKGLLDRAQEEIGDKP